MGTHQAANRTAWAGFAPAYAEAAERHRAATEPSRGTVGRPERDPGLLGDVHGLDVLELGCGTAYWSAWLQRRGARPIGLDLTPAQLATARRMQAAHGQRCPLLEADGEAVPLRNGSVDLVLSEYGASIWCNPHRWVAEAARVLRPGGRLVFLVNSWLAVLCQDDVGEVSDRLRRDWRTPRRIEWPDDGSIEFQRPPREWITLLRGHGFEAERLEHLVAAADADAHPLWPALPSGRDAGRLRSGLPGSAADRPTSARLPGPRGWDGLGRPATGAVLLARRAPQGAAPGR